MSKISEASLSEPPELPIEEGLVRTTAILHRSPGSSLTEQPALRPANNPFVDPDPHMMILLADQEIEDGRLDQAESLIDAAFAACDQRALW
jgi:hypothetical protein